MEIIKIPKKEGIIDRTTGKVIIGGYDENENIDQYLIRFILKREFDLSLPKEVPEEFIIQKNEGSMNNLNVKNEINKINEIIYFKL